MSRLFVQLYLDEDVSVILAKMLAARGVDVTTTVEEGMLRAGDAEQLAWAAAAGRALVTHNRRHFELLAEEYHVSGVTHAGIFIAARHPPRIVAGRLLTILDRVTADEMIGGVRYL